MPELLDYRDQPWEDFAKLMCNLGGDEVEAFHAMLFAGIYFADQDAHNAVVGNNDLGSTIYPQLTARVKHMTEAGIKQKRLRALPSVGQNGCTQQDLYAQILLLLAGSDAGEDVRFVWSSQLVQQLENTLPNSRYVENHRNGNEQGVARGSFWLVQKAGEMILLRTMDYKDDKQKKPQTKLFIPPFNTDAEADLERYITKILSVFQDPNQSFDMQTALDYKLRSPDLKTEF
jgi:hypothetical protein